MKKHKVASWKRQRVGKTDAITIGIDLGDRTSQYCVVNAKGEVIERAAVTTTNKGMAQAIGSRRQSRVAIEVGDPFAVGQPAFEKLRPRGNRGQRAASAADQQEQPEK
jgi:hypothetical protein